MFSKRRRMSTVLVVRLTGLVLLANLGLTACSRHLPVAPDSGAQPIRGEWSTRNADPFEDEVVVTVVNGTDVGVLAADYGATVLEQEGNSVTLQPGGGETPASLALRLSTDLRVTTAEQNGAIETAESRQQSVAFDDGNGTYETYVSQPAADSVGLDAAHRVSSGDGVLVAILDTGAALDHPALAGHIVGGWDFIDRDPTPSDDPDLLDNDGDGHVDEAHGHGTHVAGIIARTAPRARLMIVRVLDADGQGDILSVSAGIEYAIEHGAQVINMSLGMLRSSDVIQHMLAQAEEEHGIVCVASAGNWSGEVPAEFPATSSHVLAVAAVDSDRRAATFTSFGSFVAISAPGVSVRSAFWDGGYVLWSGTSMAAPFVSGTAALLLSVHPDWSQAEVMDRLASSARPAVAVTPSQVGRLGAGALNAAAALAPDARFQLLPRPQQPGSPWSPPGTQ